MNKIVDIFRENFELIVYGVLGLLVVVLLVAVGIGSVQETKERKAHEAAWMAECQQDKKHYECEAMWRAGEKHDTTTVIPMPVVISR